MRLARDGTVLPMRSASKAESAEREIPFSVATSAGGASALWISWNEHRRTTGLCAAWDVPLHVIHSKRRGVLRWIDQALQTMRLLHRRKPRILLVQNPSLALTTLVAHIRPLFGYCLVVDAHNEGVRPFARTGRIVSWLTRRLLNLADVTIVTNDALAEDVGAAGGRALVLPDRLPEPELPIKLPAKGEEPLVAVISSFMADEPIDAIISAAGALPGVQFAFTGDARRFRSGVGALPPNVRLTGYLAEPAFWKLLSRADVICDLTLKPDCLVCGAYEALAVAKPMVLSDNEATRLIFGSAAVLTGSDRESIAAAVRSAIDQDRQLGAAARRLREAYPGPWRLQAQATWDAICRAARSESRKFA